MVQTNGVEYIRPLSVKEILQARLECFNTEKDDGGKKRTLDERLALFDQWFATSTGIVYRAGTDKFKIDSVSKEIVSLDQAFNERFLAVDYNQISGIELDSTQHYNEELSKSQIENHSGWQALVEGDLVLLKQYRDTVFKLLKQRAQNKKMPERAMGFYVRKNTPEDELGALFVSDLSSSSALGGNCLNDLGRFVRKVVQAPAGAAGAKKT